MARSFDGSNDDITTSSVDLSTASGDQITIGFWYFPDTLDGSVEVLFEQTTNYNLNNGAMGIFPNQSLGVSPPYDISFEYRASGGARVVYTDMPSASTWTHIAWVVDRTDANNFIIYFNAVSQSFTITNNAGTGVAFRNDVAYFGERAGTSFPLSGDLQEFAIWDGALDVAQIGALADGFAPPMVSPSALLAYWPFKGVHSPEIELIQGADGTINGATKADHNRMIYPRTHQIITAPSAAAGPTIPVFHHHYNQMKVA